jgi:hypothetical protein
MGQVPTEQTLSVRDIYFPFGLVNNDQDIRRGMSKSHRC